MKTFRLFIIFGSDRKMEVILSRNFNRIETDIENMINELLPKGVNISS